MSDTPPKAKPAPAAKPAAPVAPVKIDPAKTHMVKEYKHTSPLVGCRFDPSGQFVFAGAQDNAVVRWRLDDGKATPLVGHKSWVRALAFSPPSPPPQPSPTRGEGEKQPPSGGEKGVGEKRPSPPPAEKDREKKPSPAQTGEKAGQSKPPPPLWGRGGVGGERLLFSGDYAGRVLVWRADADKPEPIRTLDAHRGWVRALALSPDGKTLASCGNDHLVKLWSVADGKPLGELAGHACHVYNVAFHPDGKHLVSADLKGVVKVWDLATAALEREMDAKILYKYDPSFMADHGGVRGMAFNPDGSLLACAGITDVTNAFAGVGKPLVVLFDWASGKQKQLMRPKENFQGTAWAVIFHPDGFLASVGGGNGGVLWFWKPDKGQDFFHLKLPNNARDLDLHPDSRRLAVAFFDGAVRVYSMEAPPGK
jgi:WD40 repeat protein